MPSRCFSFFLFAWVSCLLPLGVTTATAAAAETDPRLHADGKGWRLQKANRTDPTRPRVLLVGDSILNGYLKAVIQGLGERADVDAWVNPYHQANGDLERMVTEVLAQGPYDVIHFNLGLHGWQPGRIPEGQFDPLTEKLVQTLRRQAPKARLIWANSTPVTVKGNPLQLDPTIDPIIIEHNRMAAVVMERNKIPINDFYGLLVSRLEWARGDQFHWKTPAYDLLASQIVTSVGALLPARAR